MFPGCLPLVRASSCYRRQKETILLVQVRAAILSSSTWGAIDNSYLYTDTPNAIGNSLLVDPLATLCLETGADYVNITESSAR